MEWIFVAVDPFLLGAAIAAITVALIAAVATKEVSDRARDMAADIQDAIRVSHRMLKVAAQVVGMPLPVLSRWLNPTTPSQITRLADLGEHFEREFITRRAKKCGLCVVDERLGAALELVDAMYREQERSA